MRDGQHSEHLFYLIVDSLLCRHIHISVNTPMRTSKQTRAVFVIEPTPISLFTMPVHCDELRLMKLVPAERDEMPVDGRDCRFRRDSRAIPTPPAIMSHRTHH